MNRNMIRVGLATLAMGVVTGWAGEKEISIEKLPDAVRATAEKSCPKGIIAEASKEKEKGKVIYKVELKLEEKECELEIAADGTLLETSIEIDAAQLPEKVQESLSIFEDIEIEESAYVQEGDSTFYELEIEVDEQSFEIEITPAGKITELKAKSKKHDDEDDDDGEDEGEHHDGGHEDRD